MHDYSYLNIEAPLFILDCSNDEVDTVMRRIRKLVPDMDKINIHNIVLENAKPHMIGEITAIALENPLLHFYLRLIRADYMELHDVENESPTPNIFLVLKSFDPDCKSEICLIECDKNNYENVINHIAKVDSYEPQVSVFRPLLNLMNLPDHKGLGWDQLDRLYCTLIDQQRASSKRVMIEYGFLSTRLLTEHPCNGYVCGGKHCHSGKNNLPRRIYVDHNGHLCPEHPRLPEQYSMGSIDKNPLLRIMELYKGSEAHESFLRLARSVYVEWVSPCPFRVIPWPELMLINANKYHEDNI